MPRFANRKLTEISVDDVARVVTDMQTVGYSPWTISQVITVLSAVMRKAVRSGLVAVNPVSNLERGERPRLVRTEKRILSQDEISKLLRHAGKFRPLVAVMTFAGLRISEALGLIWDDVNFEEGFLHVRKQLGRDRQRVEPKTATSRRDVVLAKELASVLREHRLASAYREPTDFVFPTPDGKGREHSATTDGVRRALRRAGLAEAGITSQSFRHTFASMLIVGLKLDPARVAAQLGHGDPSISLSIYTHLFEKARHADELREALNEGFGHLLAATSPRDRGEFDESLGSKQLAT